MKLKPRSSIPELLAQLPPGCLTPTDTAVLRAAKALIHALRVPVDTTSTPYLFPPDTCAAFAVELTDALAQLIQARLPRRRQGRPSMAAEHRDERERKRERANAAYQFKTRIASLTDALRAYGTRMKRYWNAQTGEEHRAPIAAPAIERVRAAHAALRAAVPDDAPTALTEALDDMDAIAQRLERVTAWWVTTTAGASDESAGLHTHPSIAEWIDACRQLARENSVHLHNL